METNNTELNISSYASEIGKVEDRISITKNTDKDIAISFSAKYMMDALKTFNEDELLILLNTDSSPIILKSIKDESLIKDKYTYHKIDSYQTEIGTLYILGKEKQEADIKYKIYVGALKYKEGNNQELIFELGYLHDDPNDITSLFKDIVKEVNIKNNVEE